MTPLYCNLCEKYHIDYVIDYADEIDGLAAQPRCNIHRVFMKLRPPMTKQENKIAKFDECREKFKERLVQLITDLDAINRATPCDPYREPDWWIEMMRMQSRAEIILDQLG
jgi:hypothetical protein